MFYQNFNVKAIARNDLHPKIVKDVFRGMTGCGCLPVKICPSHFVQNVRKFA